MIVFNQQTVEALITDEYRNFGDDEDNDRGYETNEDEDEDAPIADTAVIGDPMNEAKAENVTRLYCQNINGIKWDKDGGTWPSICDTMAAIHCDITCLSELNQDVNQYQVSNKMRSIERKFFQHSRFAASTSTRQVHRTYKPGGTGMLVVEETTSAVKKMTRDRMGRWVTTQLVGVNNRKVTIITAYQVCQNTATGSNTASNQQISQLIEEASATATNIRPREAFIHELLLTVKHYQDRGDEIVLVGDFNEEVTNNDDTFSVAINQLRWMKILQ
jgi:exonuclease III